MKALLSLFLAVLMASAGSAIVSAAVVVDYDVTNANAASANTVAIASEDANVTSTTMQSVGALGTPFNSPASFCYLDWPTGALDASEYYEYSVTPDGGYGVVYESIDLAVASGGAGTVDWEIHASTDGFAGSDINLGGASFPADATWHAFNLDISALGTQTGTITFRFYMYNSPGSGFTGLGQDPAFGNQGRNFTVNGRVEEQIVQTEHLTWGRVKAERR